VAILFREYELLAKSELFDPEYYRRANPEIGSLNIDPLTHYIETGCRERRNPSARFDTSHYLSQCEPLGETPTNPLFHYLTIGLKRGFTPKPKGRANGKVLRAAPQTHEPLSPSTNPAGSEKQDASSSSAKAATIPSPSYESAITQLNVAPTEVIADVKTDPDARKEVIAEAETAVTGAAFPGYIDSFGYSSAAGGWIYNGWISRPFRTDLSEPVEFVAHYERSQNSGKAILAFYEREDLDQKSIGVIAYLLTSTHVIGHLQSIVFEFDGVKYQALSGPSTERLLDQQLVERVRSNLISQAFANQNRTHLLTITARRGFAGHDTLNSLSEPVFLEIDEAILCPPDSVLLKGWHLAAPGIVRRIRVRSGSLASELQLSDAVSVARQDVVDTVGQKLGFCDLHVGFTAYVRGAISAGDATYIEIELDNDEVGFKSFKISKRSGIDAIRRILDGIDIRYDQTEPTFENVLGPAIHSLNAARLEKPVVPSRVEFGRVPDNAMCSLVIPLYGRIDFVEYQMAFFSRDPEMRASEIIYVLDDPSKRRELEVLATSVFERFRIPFRLLLLPRNLGFAPANNIGLKSARGKYICFLNSDAFPITDGWLSSLTARLAANPDVGVLGARLLFEDGSVQHEGCYYRQIAEFGNWTFIEHLNKGRRPARTVDLRRCDAITGACMLMERALAVELGGFDEAFIIGDFEDSDLCLRVKGRGLTCAVDPSVQLYHLERKSQAAPNQNWRMNLTLYNAWVHERRWSQTLQSLLLRA
jgi:GT2 family glycosyltransferase